MTNRRTRAADALTNLYPATTVIDFWNGRIDGLGERLMSLPHG